MPSEDDPKKPMPSAEEINAYLEASAARTKKRLPLAFDKPARADEKKKSRALPTTQGKASGVAVDRALAGTKPNATEEPAPAAWEPPRGEGRD